MTSDSGLKEFSLLAQLRDKARNAPESGIVEVANYGRPKSDVISLWVGESDIPTPAFISDAASRALAAGETFYTWNRGIPELREALARYHSKVYDRKFSADEFFVTASGMQSIVTAFAMTAGAGDEVLIPTPTWPNAAAAVEVLGANAVEVPMNFGNAGWSLDFDRLTGRVNNRTRALFIVSPSNPTGWAATLEDIQNCLDFARRHRLWIVADETYARFWYGAGSRSPSFYDVMAADDQIIFVNTFSKNWAMTGWRIGWIATNPALGQVIENLIQYSTSGVAPFMQRAAIAALDEGEDFLAEHIARVRLSRNLVCDALGATGRCRFAIPQGAFYLFFSVDGENDTRELAFRLIDEARVGLAPGSAFGAGGEKFLRMCIAKHPAQMEEAARRIIKALPRS